MPTMEERARELERQLELDIARLDRELFEHLEAIMATIRQKGAERDRKVARYQTVKGLLNS